MALYRYTSNKSEWDDTATIIVGYNEDGSEKVMHKGGDPVDLTDAELEGARPRFNISELTDKQKAAYEEEQQGGAPEPPSRRAKKAAAKQNDQPADDNAGGVVDPTKGGNAVDSLDAGTTTGDGQGSRGASGQDVGTTTGGSR